MKKTLAKDCAYFATRRMRLSGARRMKSDSLAPLQSISDMDGGPGERRALRPHGHRRHPHHRGEAERGKLRSALGIKGAGLVVLPITGRPAGWCDLIAREWPVERRRGRKRRLRVLGGAAGAASESPCPSGRDPQRRPRPALALRRSHSEVPGCRPARDQFARLYDIAIDFAEEEPALPLSDALKIKAICDEEGAKAKVSSIHVNAWMGDYDKLSMATSYLAARFGYDDGRDRAAVLFAGDSPNDEPMFAHFPMACGVANVRRYEKLMRVQPAFVATKECGAGFAEIADTLLARRSPAAPKREVAMKPSSSNSITGFTKKYSEWNAQDLGADLSRREACAPKRFGITTR